MSTSLHAKVITTLFYGLRPKITIITIFYLIFLFLYSFTVSAQSSKTVFPGAEGYGQYTKGGRGGAIIKVTNLNSSGPGSLRNALLSSGPRTVVFEVSGTINIGGAITIRDPFLTIAGQTAPSPGILVRGGSITIKTHDVLIQHLRIRAGNTGDDCLKMSTAGSGEVYNVYLDHLSLSWAKDEVLSIYQRDARVYDISVSHCFITEGLAKNNSYTGAKGFLIGKDPNKSVSEVIGDVSVTSSLFAHNNQRNPYMKNGTRGILCNNVMYSYRHSAVEIGDDDGEFMVSAVNNVFRTRVPANKPPISLRTPGSGGKLYMSNNMYDGNMPSQNQLINTSFALQSNSPVNLSSVDVIPTSQTMDYVLTNSGARPVDRDAVDVRIINEVKTRTGDWMDQTEVDSYYPNLAVNNKSFSIANANGDDDGDGYTNLEEKLHELKLQVEGKSAGEEPEPNNAPTISAIADQKINQDASTDAIAFTVADDQTALNALTITGSSSNASLVGSNGIAFSGTGASRTVKVTPTAGQFGVATITVTVSDGEKDAAESFTLTVVEDVPANTAPSIASIGNYEIEQDTQLGPISFNISDQETNASQLTLLGSSDNQSLIGNASISFAGSGAQRTVTIVPAAGQIGVAKISITVSDSDLSSTETFEVNVVEKDVDPVNTAPSISSIADQEVEQDNDFGPLGFTVSDQETSASQLSVTATSDNQSIIKDSKISIAGTGSQRSISIQPESNKYGKVTISLVVSDGELDSEETFVLNVTEKDVDPVNTAPSISSIADQEVEQDNDFGPIGFTVSDQETSASQLLVTATSDDQSIINNNKISIAGTGSQRSISIQPESNKYGKVTISLVVSDGELDSEETFVLNVLEKDEEPTNTAPTISAIADQVTDQDETMSPIAFTIGDAESSASSLTVSAGSSNQGVISNQNLSLSGSGANRSITISPNNGAYGTSDITITVNDGELSTSTTFSVKVEEAVVGGDPGIAPVIGNIANQFAAANSTIGPVSFFVDDDYTPVSSLTLSGYSSNNGLVNTSQIKFGGSGNERNFTITPTGNKSGRAVITITVSDGNKTASTSFYLTVKRKGKGKAQSAASVASNSPNPFSNKTTISYTVEQENNVALQVFDMRGHLLRTLVRGRQSSGEHQAEWDRMTDRGELVQDGMYIYRLRIGSSVIMNRMIIRH